MIISSFDDVGSVIDICTGGGAIGAGISIIFGAVGTATGTRTGSGLFGNTADAVGTATGTSITLVTVGAAIGTSTMVADGTGIATGTGFGTATGTCITCGGFSMSFDSQHIIFAEQPFTK